MAHAESKKAFIVRFFADGGFRVEGPFPPAQVQRFINAGDCHAWLQDWALFAVWGKNPIVDVDELFYLSPEIQRIARRLAHKRYQTLKANLYRVQEARHFGASNQEA
jgi:hypothetical protein